MLHCVVWRGRARLRRMARFGTVGRKIHGR
jgi:hypothetical protein